MTSDKKNICVFLGSRAGNDPEFLQQTKRFARCLVANNLNLVFGGSNVGLMKALSDNVIDCGGEVTGVYPHGLFEQAEASANLTRLHSVLSMHERKALMAELSSGFVALPGGLGTLEEIFEALTWTQIGMHSKPCGFLNISGFYDNLLTFLDGVTEQGFVSPKQRSSIIANDDPDILIKKMLQHHAFMRD